MVGISSSSSSTVRHVPASGISPSPTWETVSTHDGMVVAGGRGKAVGTRAVKEA